MRSTFSLAVLGFAASTAALNVIPRQDYGGYNPPPSGPSSTSSAAAAVTTGPTGGKICTDLMCVSGIVNGSTIQYTLESTGKDSLGWMAMGFGSQMANTPMVIMWSNSDGSVTLSQRKAPSEVMPTVDSSPPRAASVDMSAVALSGSQPQFGFTIPTDSTSLSSVPIIWAFGTTNPGSSAKDATLLQHAESGPTKIDLSKPLESSGKPVMESSSAGVRSALPVGIAGLVIAFGLWSADGAQSKDVERHRLHLRTEEILWEIATRPTFACAIRAITVQAFIMLFSGAVFETQLLTRALRALSSTLTTFRWFEHEQSPMTVSEVLPAIAQSMGPTLRELHLPLTCLTNPSLGAFTSLRRFELDIGPDGDASGYEEHVDLIEDSDLELVRQIVYRNRSTLHHLVAPGALIWRLPSRVFEGLHTLDITSTTTVDGLHAVVGHCNSIRDFSLVLTGLHSDENLHTIAVALRPHKLPLLVAFKIVFKDNCMPSTENHILLLTEIASFLWDRKGLRRLHIQPAYYSRPGEGATSPLILVMPTLPNLTTLGLEIGCPLKLDRLILLETLIPPTVTALRLDCIFRNLHKPFQDRFLDIIRSRGRIRYLHIFDETYPESELKDRLREDPPPELELLGFGPFVRWRFPHPDPSVDSLPEWSPRWPPWKLRFRGARDFGNADWAWLMRHRLPSDNEEIVWSEPGPSSWF
ncbi:uncharacterized protein BXZ73DRAFT_102905 [Epithele typhae]|uniref:uncharacterized protein n=1 Tax=Epithele typhae TaxID=378194 RepID=UPI0020075D5B|nr:uncharacterized protein BXZ73DRAFT_102905 [Epithele typhae]KAH9926649.1 hypothetical protein BXZ73DRAFT_102905 [Epithele typhae]